MGEEHRVPALGGGWEPAMSNSEQLWRPHVPDGTPTIEMRVYRDGRFIFSQLCESEEEIGRGRAWVGSDRRCRV